VEKFTKLTSAAVYLPIANIDTDMIIPKQYLKTIKRSGLGRWLFAGLRYNSQGNPQPDFVLNKQPRAQILMAGENFGCGSSREHAPWALMDFGIRAIIAPGFADIFYNNCFKNGLLPTRLENEAITALANEGKPVTIDLTAQKITCGALTFSFKIEANNKKTLLDGLDGVATILQNREVIEVFESKYFTQFPWLSMKVKEK